MWHLLRSESLPANVEDVADVKVVALVQNVEDVAQVGSVTDG